jgi:hypothetical protein
MENKYYQPQIEEFRVGFEYEQLSINPQEDITVSNEIKYEKCKFPDPFLGYRLDRLNLSNIRVKYLDKEDIESLGFYQITNNCFNLPINEDNELRILFKDNEILIYFADRYSDLLFQGTIKNLSELKVLLKQLFIEKKKGD